MWTISVPRVRFGCSRMPRCRVVPTASLVSADLGCRGHEYNADWRQNSRPLTTCERQCSSVDRGRPLAPGSAWRTLDNRCLAHPTRCFLVSACTAPGVRTRTIRYYRSFAMIWIVARRNTYFIPNIWLVITKLSNVDNTKARLQLKRALCLCQYVTTCWSASPEFVYLGSLVTKNNDCSAEISRRIRDVFRAEP